MSDLLASENHSIMAKKPSCQTKKKMTEHYYYFSI